MAKLLAYADCSVQVMLTNKDPRLCDCNRIVDNEDIPFPDQPDKQRELSIKADWKYTASEHFSFNGMPFTVSVKPHTYYNNSLPGKKRRDIFQPPRV